MFHSLIATVLFCVLASLSVHAETTGLVVYRDATGELTQQSRKNLSDLIKVATREGPIAVWVVFDIPFEGNPDLRTPDVIESEAASKRAAFSEHVSPLIAQGLAVELDSGVAMLDEAPGAMLRVTANGLRRLSRDPGIKHIGHIIYE